MVRKSQEIKKKKIMQVEMEVFDKILEFFFKISDFVISNLQNYIY